MYYEVVEMDFKYYVKGVLPNEWVRFWPEESLKAGAIAAKMYAMSVYNSQGYVWDCTWSQVFNPLKRTPETDKAVDDTWEWILTDGGIIRTYYNADMWGCATQGDNCMGQWESRQDALNGMMFDDILLKYYDGFLIKVRH
jgi:SpoIID/LytB domain protein